MSTQKLNFGNSCQKARKNRYQRFLPPLPPPPTPRQSFPRSKHSVQDCSHPEQVHNTHEKQTHRKKCREVKLGLSKLCVIAYLFL